MTELNLLHTHLVKENGTEVLPSSNFMNFKNLIVHYLHQYATIGPFDIKEHFMRNDYSTDSNKKYFYGICPQNLTFSTLAKFDFGIPKDSLQDIQNNKNFFVIITMEHEPIHEEDIIQVTKKAKELGLENRVLCLTNNAYTKELFETIGNGISIGYKINFLDWSTRHILTHLEIGDIQENKNGKLFLCRNRNAKPHRLSLIYKLLEKGYMNEINYSYVPEFFPNNVTMLGDMKMVYSLVLTEEEVEEKFEEIQEIYQRIKIDDIEEEYNVIGEGNIFENSHIQNRRLFMVPEIPSSFHESYLNIVTESCFESNTRHKKIIHPSEKSFRPYMYYQIPLFVATYNHVKYLRETYNFDMFDDLINHSYDDEFDDKKRLSLIIDEIGRLIENKDKVIEFYKNNVSRIKKNKEIFLKVSQELREKDVLFLKEFIDS